MHLSRLAWVSQAAGRLVARLGLGLLVATVAVVVVGPRLLPYRVVFVRSASMEPTLPMGALAVLRPVDARRLRLGDVVTYLRPSQPPALVTHRVVSFDDGPGGRRLVTKGDANAHADAWHPPASGRVWRVAGAVPMVGYAVGYLGSPWPSLAIGVLLVVAGLLVVRSRRRQDDPSLRPRLAGGAAVLAVVTTMAAAEGTFASFQGETRNPGNGFSTAALGAPTGLAATASGHDVALSWSAGTNGAGYAVEGVGNGTSTDCSTAAFSGVGTTAGTSYTDAGRHNPQGTTFCYRVKTTYASWASVSWICLEITETALVQDLASSTEKLRALKSLGLTVAVDDFGTGYASLVYLRQLPVDLVKIDRSFVEGITFRPEDRIIVSSVISLAHSLNKTALAEGVETNDQLACLAALNCDVAQGYYFHPPMTGAAISQLLGEGIVERAETCQYSREESVTEGRFG